MATISLRWIDDGSVSFQTVIKKATSTDGGQTWTDLGVIYDDTVHPPPGFNPGLNILDIDVGVPKQNGYVIVLPTSGSSNPQYVYVPNDSNPTPIPIDTTNKPTPPSAFGTQRNFWVDTNGNLWVVGESPVLHNVTVYKSTNNGVTWTLMDAAHAPSVANTGNWYWDVVNSTKIQFIVADGSGFMALQEFDTTPGIEKYGAVHSPNSTLGTGWSLGQVVVSGATIAVLYAAAASPFKASLAIFNGSSWNNIGIISNDTFLCTAGIDASGNSYLVHGHVDGSNNPVMTVSVYSSTGTHIGDAAFPSGSADGDLTGAPTDAVQQPYTDAGNMIFPTRCFSTSGQQNGATFLCPLGAAALSGPFFVQASTTGQFYGGQVGLQGTPPTIACPVNNQAILGVFFTSSVIAAGTAPLTYSIVGGALPPGLMLNPTTGVISGIPTQRGVFSYSVQVTDANGLTAQTTCPLTVSNFQQVIFQGVRRQKGSLPLLIDKSCYHPKSFTITASAVINSLGDLPVVYPPVTLIQPIYDYPFEWHDLKLTFASAGVVPGRVCALFLYDPVKNQLSNLPVMDIYYNGAPGSLLKNGALVPPLIYPANGEIQVDLFSLIKDPLVLPVTVNLHFVGFRLFPK